MDSYRCSGSSYILYNKCEAQTTNPNQWRFGIGVEGGIPTGNVTNVSNFDLGGTARLQYGLGKTLL